MGRARDDLETHIAERTASDPELPARIDAALRRRELLRALGDERRAKGLPRTAIAVRMGESPRDHLPAGRAPRRAQREYSRR